MPSRSIGFPSGNAVIQHYPARGHMLQHDRPDRIAEGLQASAGRHPLKRLGQANEIAALALHLATDEAAFITGAVIPIDGGLSAVGWQVGQ